MNGYYKFGDNGVVYYRNYLNELFHGEHKIFVGTKLLVLSYFKYGRLIGYTFTIYYKPFYI
jgi:hypothetical protein